LVKILTAPKCKLDWRFCCETSIIT
jgi:hypothetical protein